MVPFIDDMPAAFARADLVICRAGAGAVAELAAAGKPAILVPLPTAADEHQLRNAEAFEQGRRRAYWCWIGKWTAAGSSKRCAEAVVRNRNYLKRMGDQARKLAHPEAARRAADLVEASLSLTI